MWSVKLPSAKYIITFFVLMLLNGSVFAASEAGIILKIKGEATRTSPDGMDEENLEEGSTIYSGDSIQTGAKAFVRISFKDKTIVNLSQKAKFLVRKFDYDPQTKKRETIFGLVKGQMRSLVRQKVEEGQNVKFQGRAISFGVRGTTILANAYKAAKLPVNDLAIVEGSVTGKTAAGKAFQVSGGQFLNSSTFATAGVQAMSAAALKALQDGAAFLPNLVGPNGLAIPLDKALAGLGAGLGAAAGALAVAGALIPDSDSDDDSNDNKKDDLKKTEEKKEEKKEEVVKQEPKPAKFSYLPSHNGVVLDLTKEPDDIREVIQQRVQHRSQNICFFWFYKSLPGGGKKERFRRKRECNEFEFDD